MFLSNIQKYSEDFLFLPIGGVGEIGMNAYLYQYKGKWVLIDLGIGFATNDQSLPGIDIILPDISFIKKIKDDLLAIIVTHAHEDHCGAIHYLWNEIECPVYADSFTIEFIRNKCLKNGVCENINLNVLSDRLKIGAFDMEFIHMTHSIPFMNGIVFRTEFGNYFHTGDWKIDENPIVGEKSNLKRLREIQETENGFRGVISDSTNVTIKEKTASEGSLIQSMEEIFEKSKSLIACTMFASNVARLRMLCNVAKKFNRKIVVFGRSLNNIIGISHQFSIFNDVEFLDEEQISGIPREDLLLICTGCQGEELAAISSLANERNRFISLQAEDTVIFSSKTIPGNELNVNSVINKLIIKNVNVITERTHNIHVSGHPGCEDLKILYNILKPKFIVPVHGEPLHLREHVNFAKEMKIQDAIFTKNGVALKLNNDKIEVVDSIAVNFLCLDGKFDIVNPDDESIRERGFLNKNGIIMIILVVGKKMILVKSPRVMSFGILNYRSPRGERIITKISSHIANDIFVKSDLRNARDIRNKVRSYVRNLCKKETGKIPMIEINVDILSDR